MDVDVCDIFVYIPISLLSFFIFLVSRNVGLGVG